MQTSSCRLCLLIPVYDDWESVALVLAELDTLLAGIAGKVHTVLVDDGSPRPGVSAMNLKPLEHIGSVEILELRCNLGHQRAIAMGLAYIEDRKPCGAVVIMDGDGQDRPADVQRLLAKFEQESGTRTIFARRARRSERWWFRTLYTAYVWLHRFLVGLWYEVGNFSIVPSAHVARLVAIPGLWHHFAAAAIKARIPFDTIDTARAPRVAGESKMNFQSLVLHGLRALTVYVDIIVVRMLVVAAVVLLASLLGVGLVVCIPLVTSLVAPAWTINLMGLIAVLMAQVATISIILVFVLLAGGHGSPFLPIRDYRYFVRNTIVLPPAG